jgi:hypothetical protein
MNFAGLQHSRLQGISASPHHELTIQCLVRFYEPVLVPNHDMNAVANIWGLCTDSGCSDLPVVFFSRFDNAGALVAAQHIGVRHSTIIVRDWGGNKRDYCIFLEHAMRFQYLRS